MMLQPLFDEIELCDLANGEFGNFNRSKQIRLNRDSTNGLICHLGTNTYFDLNQIDDV